MNFFRATCLLLTLLNSSPIYGFTPARLSTRRATSTNVKSTPSSDDIRRMQLDAAEQMKNIKPEDLERMTKEMENMNPLQKGALKAMGMDPEMMKKTMEMMRDNPEMVESAQKIMQTMSPEELMEQSRLAQEKMKTMTPDQLDETGKAMKSIPKEQIDAAVDVLKETQAKGRVIEAEVEDDDDGEEPKVMETGPGSSSDPEVVDTMFRVAELLSDPPSGGCTFAGFASLPVIELMSGDREADLSPKELKECWADGSLGSTRVDRVGFERVWKEVQDYFEDDILGEARKEAKNRATAKGRGAAAKPTSPVVGQNMSDDQMKAVNEQVKKMSDDDVGMMLDSMQKMGPAEEARMKAMGVDPAMMRKTAEMMKNNPMMRDAAQTMMKNMTPEQMKQASQQAQQQMAGMSREDIEKAMDELSKK